MVADERGPGMANRHSAMGYRNGDCDKQYRPVRFADTIVSGAACEGGTTLKGE
jgi:hypothetical protein